MNQIDQMPQPDTHATSSALPPNNTNSEDTGSERPDHIPEKFWNAEQNAIRTEELLKSYGELERRLGEGTEMIPEDPDGYALDMPDEAITPDPEVNARLHAAGFSQEQAQLVYDLAHEKLAPLMAQMGSELESEAAVSRLESHFGGKAKWQEASRQIKAWGQSNLGAETFTRQATHRAQDRTGPHHAQPTQPARYG